jgi:hypothetical protein
MEYRRTASNNCVRVLALVVVLAFAAMSASADSIFVSQYGVFGGLVPRTAVTAPHESWSYYFELSTTPSVTNAGLGCCFNPVISDIEYVLNGAVVPNAISSATFFIASQAGLIDVGFAGGGTLSDFGFQAYSGPETSPTILPGVYLISPGSFLELSNGRKIPVGGDLYINSTPEPSSLLLMGSGLVGLGGLLRRKLRA